MFLTAEEMHQLTGYELPSWQRRWLKSKGWKFEEARGGYPVVLRSYAVSRLSAADSKASWTPNIASLKKVA